MGENGKRLRSHRDDGDSKNQKRRVDRESDRDEKGNDELIVYRILCPDSVIGSVIGKSGKVINSIRQETRAKVKVLDPFPGARDRVIMIYCYVREKEDVEVDDEFNNKEPLCPAQYALLKMHEAIANAVAMVGDFDRKNNYKNIEECKILVPSSQSANIIGKSGSTIKKLRNKTRTNIKITSKDASDPSHSCALEFDNFVLISGDSEAVKKAVFAISAIMYKFSPKEDIPLDVSIPETPPSIIIPSDVPIYPATGFYQSVDPIIPSRSVPSILGPADAPYIPSRADAGNTWSVYSSTLPMVSGYGGMSRSEELTVKVLCPSNKIGRVIGKGGSSIKRIRQDSGAHIEVEDPKANYNECVISIISTESLDDLKSTAVEAVLLLQGKINDEDDDTVTLRLLVPSKVIGYIIGKSGSIINEIRKRTKADIQISKGEKPKCADANDELVEIVGEVVSLRDALIQIVLRLRDDVLKDKEGGHISSGGAGFSVPSVLPSIRPAAPMAYEHSAETESGVGLLSSRTYGSLLTGDSGYGSFSSHSSSLYGRLPPPSTVEMVVPAYAVGKVMGKGGMNIENMRKISGAAIEISDSKSSRGDRVALISGTAEEKRAAENLIQAFIMAA
ncbi:KH domain-containing protein At4g18375-like [Olea europaea var. sylvestris]|uniref:KH domain-containing protein At4g18375-like n=1 Tax=Olea europaea var. sylvestris TaxID=158386 RepID=UPI000C1D3180|nr:KH domain-containing protein At4g18375-like [Olea europaea var. sylvestris]XP_022892413.1 KH domain-containing protein At4g18375-like [Olea europaea var. sylvestris]